jgi:hypothetical protein
MFFNRHEVYHMALDYAKANGFEYDWFVSARLDGGWVSPIEPLSHFSPQRVWVPANWQEFVPDIFALLPLKAAEVYFELNHHMGLDVTAARAGTVMCLGGPDFDASNCNISHLVNELHLNTTHAERVVGLCCKTPAGHNGHSEGILKDLLKENGLFAEAAPFHTFIARDHDIGAYCGSFEPQYVSSPPHLQHATECTDNADH